MKPNQSTLDFVLRARLQFDSDFLSLCMMKLYEQQESDEQAAGITHYENGVGFTKPDSSALSEYCEHILAGKRLTDAQFEDAATRMLKYTGQLLTLLTEEQITS